MAIKTSSPEPAWSPEFWKTLLRNTPKPAIVYGLQEIDYLFRAVLKKSTNTLIVPKGSIGYWDSIEPEEYQKWQWFMRIWGWGDNQILWRSTQEPSLLRASLRAFSLSPDGALPKTLTVGAWARRTQLENFVVGQHQQEQLPYWRTANLQDADPGSRKDALDALKKEQWLQLPMDIKQYHHAVQELAWKQAVSERIYTWLERTGRMPLSTTTPWLRAWGDDASSN